MEQAKKQESGSFRANEKGYKLIYYYRYFDYSLVKGVVGRGNEPQFIERACMGVCLQHPSVDGDYRLGAYARPYVVGSCGEPYRSTGELALRVMDTITCMKKRKARVLVLINVNANNEKGTKR